MQKPNLSLKIYRKIISNEVRDNNPNIYPTTLQSAFMSFEKRSDIEIALSNTQTYESSQSLRVRAYQNGLLFTHSLELSVELETWYSLECWAYCQFSNEFQDIENQLTQSIGITINNNNFSAEISTRIVREAQGYGSDTGVWVLLKTEIYTNRTDILNNIAVYFKDTRNTIRDIDSSKFFVDIEPITIYFDKFSIKKISTTPSFEILDQNEFIEIPISSEDVATNKDFKDLESTNASGSEFSKTINIPATAEVEHFFSFFNYTNNAETARRSYKAILCVDTIPILEGDINGFNSYSKRKDEKNNSYYTIYIKEKLKEWLQKIEGKNLRELQYLDYQRLEISAIQTTFLNNGNSGLLPKEEPPIYSKFVEFGYFLYGDNDFELNKTIELNALRPHFFVKPLIVNILNQAGFNVEFEGFTESQEFAELVYTYNQEKFLLSDSAKKSAIDKVCFQFPIYDDIVSVDKLVYQVPYGETALTSDIYLCQIGWNNDILVTDVDDFRNDVEKLFNVGNGRFYATSNGTYRVQSKIYFRHNMGDRPPILPPDYEVDEEVFLDFEVDLVECDYIEIFVEHYALFGSVLIGKDQSGQDVFTNTDYLKFYYTIKGSTNKKYISFAYTAKNSFVNTVSLGLKELYYKEYAWIASTTNARALLKSRVSILKNSWVAFESVGEHEPAYQTKIPISDYLPDLEQKDFIAGIASLYDLFFVSNDQAKTIKIITFKEYIQSLNNSKDWTSKIDEKEINKKPYADKALDYLLSYQIDDNDDILKIENELSNNKYKTDFGAYLVKDETSLNEQKRLTENNIFSPTVIKKIRNAQDDIYLPIAEKSETSPRILRYIGIVEQGNIETYISYGCADELRTINGYPAMTFDKLNYRTIDSVIGLKERFWETRLNLLQNSIVMNAWFYLNLIDYLSLKFDIPVLIDGNYWLLQKVKDFNATLDKTTKVELIRLV